MNPNLKLYKVIPSVVEADKETTVTIKSLDGKMRFFDDITYEVEFIPKDESDVPMNERISLKGFDEMRKSYSVKPVNGELKLTYKFIGEQEWTIHISTNEYEKYQNPLYEKYRPYWNGHINYPKNGIRLSVYSLKQDLYNRDVLRGDLHIHTLKSDGGESPEYVAACYRKAGLDFIAITDHNVFNASTDAKEKLSFISDNFEVIHGEEVHNGYAGYFHMVNIGGDYSINDIYLNEPERVEAEVKELEAVTQVPENVDKREYLHRVWLYNAIKKSGGYAIYPHPYWDIGYYHTQTKMSIEILENGLCDAYEILGGCTPEQNNMQVELYHEMRARGKKLPVVGSTDSHSVLGYFKIASTVVFADNGVIPAISDGYSVAVESLPNDNMRVYGDLRLMKYTHFLLKNYFPIHDERCFASGQLIEDYVHGEEALKEMIEKSEARVSEYKKEFFGR